MATKKKHSAAKKDWHTVHIRIWNDNYEKLKSISKKESRSCTKMLEVISNEAILRSED